MLSFLSLTLEHVNGSALSETGAERQVPAKSPHVAVAGTGQA